jgi:hypothetical protein
MLCQVEDGERLRREFIDQYEATYGAADARTCEAMNGVAGHLQKARQPAEAEPIARAAVEGFRRSFGSGDRRTVNALGTLAVILVDLGKASEALPVFEEEARGASGLVNDTGPRDSEVWICHAGCLATVGRFADAERELLACHAGLSPTRSRGAAKAVAGALVATYEAWHAVDPAGGHDIQANTWRSRGEIPATEHAKPR